MHLTPLEEMILKYQEKIARENDPLKQERLMVTLGFLYRARSSDGAGKLTTPTSGS